MQGMPQNNAMQPPPPPPKKSWTWVWLMIIAIVFTANFAVTLLGGVPTKAQTQKWEYGGDFATDSKLTDKFNDLGEKGWELVHCRRARNEKNTWGYECIFKRPNG